VFIAVMIAGVATTWRRAQMAEGAKTNKAISQVLAPEPTSSPITPHTSWQSYSEHNKQERREAVLVKCLRPKLN